MQPSKICDIKLVQALALLVGGIINAKTVVDHVEDGVVNGARERKRCSWRLNNFPENMKFGPLNMVIARHTKLDTVLTVRLVLIALDFSCHYCMLKRYHNDIAYFHVAELAVATTRRGLAVHSLFLSWLACCCSDTHLFSRF